MGKIKNDKTNKPIIVSENNSLLVRILIKLIEPFIVRNVTNSGGELNEQTKC